MKHGLKDTKTIYEFAKDQGILLERFCLYNINHKVVSEQQTWKNGIIGKYCHF